MTDSDLVNMEIELLDLEAWEDETKQSLILLADNEECSFWKCRGILLRSGGKSGRLSFSPPHGFFGTWFFLSCPSFFSSKS